MQAFGQPVKTNPNFPDGKTVSLRFDLIKEGIALIDYSISKIFRGRGWGKLMLAKAMLELNKNKKLKYFQAKVKKNNFKSIKIFDRLSFLKNSRGRYLEFRKSI